MHLDIADFFALFVLACWLLAFAIAVRNAIAQYRTDVARDVEIVAALNAEIPKKD